MAGMAVRQNRTARSGLRGAADRRDRRQGRRLGGREQARLCGDRRRSSRRTRCGGPVAGPDRRGGRHPVGGDAGRARQPRRRRCAGRVLRRAGRPARRHLGHLARRDGADVVGSLWAGPEGFGVSSASAGENQYRPTSQVRTRTCSSRRWRASSCYQELRCERRNE